MTHELMRSQKMRRRGTRDMSIDSRPQRLDSERVLEIHLYQKKLNSFVSLFDDKSVTLVCFFHIHMP
jgi:hypothetical protein